MNCQQVERATFPHPEVRATFDQNYVVLEVYSDEENETLKAANNQLQERLAGTVATPQYVIVDPATEKVLDQWGYGRSFVDDPPQFAARLRDGVKKFTAVH